MFTPEELLPDPALMRQLVGRLLKRDTDLQLQQLTVIIARLHVVSDYLRGYGPHPTYILE